MEIEVPNPETTDYGSAQIATEEAFNALLSVAENQGLEVSPVMGLMYLPTQEMTYAFQQACRTILLALTPPDSHVVVDGKEYWKGESVD